MKVTVARIYVTEADRIHAKIFQRLHDEHKVQGVTMFRGISGFGRSGKMHSSTLIDLAFDLPVIIEFFDEAEKVAATLVSLHDLVPPEHVITFLAEFN
jgi:PII-like signaling protein